MRVDYSFNATPDGVETRPCVNVAFLADGESVGYTALVDTGSRHTIVLESALENLDLGPVESLTGNIRFARYELKDQPVYRLGLRIKSPSDTWQDIILDGLPVVVVTAKDVELPFVILGTSVLQHLVLVFRDYECILHLKARDDFIQSAHYADDSF